MDDFVKCIQISRGKNRVENTWSLQNLDRYKYMYTKNTASALRYGAFTAHHCVVQAFDGFLLFLLGALGLWL